MPHFNGAESYTSISLFVLSNPPFLMDHQSKPPQPMFSLMFFFTFSLLSLSILIISLYKKLKKAEQQSSSLSIECSLPKIVYKTHELKLTQLTDPLLLEISPSNSSKLATLLSGEARDDQVPNGPGLDVERVDSCGEDCGKKKKRAKKNRANSKAEEGCEKGFVGKEGLEVKEKQELVCLYPFTSSSSATQRKIKQQYDQLVKSHESNGAICLTKLQTTRPDSVQRAPNPVKPSSDRRTPSTNNSRDQEKENEVSTD